MFPEPNCQAFCLLTNFVEAARIAILHKIRFICDNQQPPGAGTSRESAMNTNHDKVMTLKQAIERFVGNGDHCSIGGFTVNRNPMAAVYEIIRQKKRDLHLYAHSNGQGVDELIGAGCVSHLEIAYGGTGRFAPTCHLRGRERMRRGIRPPTRGRLLQLPDDHALCSRGYGAAFHAGAFRNGYRHCRPMGI